MAVVQGLLGCALVGQFVVVVLGVASVLSPVIVLRLAVLVLGFQVPCRLHSTGRAGRRERAAHCDVSWQAIL